MHGLKGPNHAVVTACSTGTHAIGDAARLIMLGDAEVMVAGGAESAVQPPRHRGLRRLQGAGHRLNDNPKAASRPYDRDRDGFVMGEGAGCVVLEDARTRAGARRADLCRSHRLRHVGRRLSHHRAAPRTATAPSAACRRRSSARASPPAEIDYVNAHGTSTMADDIELARGRTRWSAMRLATISMSSTKSSIGHLLGAAGAVEAIFSILAIRDQIAPADAQPRQSFDRNGDRSRAAQGAPAQDRYSAYRIPSVLAAPTPRSSFGALVDPDFAIKSGKLPDRQCSSMLDLGRDRRGPNRGAARHDRTIR